MRKTGNRELIIKDVKVNSKGKSIEYRISDNVNTGTLDHFKEMRVRTPWIANQIVRERLNRMSRSTNRTGI